MVLEGCIPEPYVIHLSIRVKMELLRSRSFVAGWFYADVYQLSDYQKNRKSKTTYTSELPTMASRISEGQLFIYLGGYLPHQFIAPGVGRGLAS
jgi:hypothetical protein